MENDDSDDDEMLFRPSGLKSPTTTTMTANTTTISVVSTDQNNEATTMNSPQLKPPQNDSMSTVSAFHSQEESPSSGNCKNDAKTAKSTTTTTTTAFSPDGFTIRKPPSTTTTIDEDITKEAQDIYNLKTIQYKEIHSTSLLKWYAKPLVQKTKTKKKKVSSVSKTQQQSPTSEKYEFVYPCYVCPSVLEAIAGFEDVITVPEKSKTLVRFIGHHVSFHDKIQYVPSKHLLPYNYNNYNSDAAVIDNDENTNNYNSDAAVIDNDDNTNNHNSDAAVIDNDENTNNNDDATTSTLRQATSSCVVAVAPNDKEHQQKEQQKLPLLWNANLMSIYLKAMKSSQGEFKNDPSHRKLKVEEQLLYIIASSVLEREQQQQQQESADALEEGEDENETDENHPTTVPLSASNTTATQSPASNHKLLPQQRKTVTTVTTLRAGDIIDYIRPVSVADISNTLRGTIMECYPGDRDSAVLLSTGHWLPSSEQIRIVQRYIYNRTKGKYEYVNTNDNESFICIDDLKVNARHNGCMDGIVLTTHERIGKIYKDTMEQVKSITMPDDETNNNHNESNGKFVSIQQQLPNIDTEGAIPTCNGAEAVASNVAMTTEEEKDDDDDTGYTHTDIVKDNSRKRKAI